MDAQEALLHAETASSGESIQRLRCACYSHEGDKDQYSGDWRVGGSFKKYNVSGKCLTSIHSRYKASTRSTMRLALKTRMQSMQ